MTTITPEQEAQHRHVMALQDEVESALKAQPTLSDEERGSIEMLIGDMIFGPIMDKNYQLPAGLLADAIERIAQFPLLCKVLEAWYAESCLTRTAETVDGPTGKAVDRVLEVLRPLVASL